MIKHRGFPGRLPGTDLQFTIRRADQPSAVEDRGVQADRVGQQARPDHLRDEGLPHRGVDGRDRAQAEGEQEDVPELDDVRRHQDAERQGQHPHQRLGDQEQTALVVAVGQDAAVHAEQQRRAEEESRQRNNGEYQRKQDEARQRAQQRAGNISGWNQWGSSWG